MGSDNGTGPSARPSVSFERILMLTFLIIVFTAFVARNEPEVHHHHYDAFGEGQAYHHYGEGVTSKSLPSGKKDTPGLRKPMPDYGASTTSPSSFGTSAYGSSTSAPGEGSESESESEDSSTSTPNAGSQSEEESTSVPEGDESESEDESASGDSSTSPPNESSASASESSD
mmetsp:Transcript_15670/g.39427  ORF Transcript_15670/g.39427 Transcript_15670/m.39427 type:complete len:172 (+) Transcript_15670:170-685(+)|eukprot:CAMPEP_0116092844 /NCGR_PEP_ID=MMETSP0327-20121206/8260_1 /TAXON_ID=44447 /ORGANISM="Pseudo-nitzschia delicatissima, Strain B596" /LENGTH=171 /DNA_ID=CAMNT_0003584299 /DNA_START=120 /DNA_END=635 /DNA_ORIENTATION=-